MPDQPDRHHHGSESTADELIEDVKLSLWPVAVVLVVLLAVNVLTNRFASDLYLLWAWLGAAVLLVIARRDGESWSAIGLGRVTKRALLASLAVIGIVLACYLVAALLPLTREAFGDDRVASLSTSEVLTRALIKVPLGTVVLEEVAFRGVLLAMLWRRIGTWPAIIGSSIVFGFWHVLPSLGLARSNDALGAAVGTDGSGRLLGVLFAVGLTFVAGIVFCELRRRFDHLIVPMSLHWATNGLGYLFAWALVNEVMN